MRELESVLIPAWMTWQRFGTKDEAYFNTYIKNRKLLILTISQQIGVMFADEHKKSIQREGHLIFTLLDDAGEPWVVHEPDLYQDKKESERLSCPWRDLVPPRPTGIVREEVIVI